MSLKLDRAGIFMVKPKQWMINTSKDSQAVAIAFEFQVLAQLEVGKWMDWRDYEEHTVWGRFYVVKKDGTVNGKTVEQLTRSLGWNGDLNAVANQEPPSRAVQITVKAEEYNGVTTFKATWMNHKDYTPSAQGADAEEVDALNSRFGSLLRAAAASVKVDAPAPEASSGGGGDAAPVDDEDDLPFVSARGER